MIIKIEIYLLLCVSKLFINKKGEVNFLLFANSTCEIVDNFHEYLNLL